MRGEYSLADIKAVTEGNGNSCYGNGMLGGDYGAWWIIIIIILFGWGRNGFGGGSNGSVADNYVLASDFATIQRQLSDGFGDLTAQSRYIQNGLCDGFYAMNTSLLNGFAGVNNAIMTNGYETRNAINNLSSDLASCCCNLRSDIQGVNYNLATNTCNLQNTMNMNTRDIVDTVNANYRALHDEIVANRIEDKNAQIQALQQKNYALELASSQANQTNYITDTIIDRLSPCPRPAYLTCNPNTTIPVQYVGASCGCNNSCGCGNY